jgi:hypothetical protein
MVEGVNYTLNEQEVPAILEKTPDEINVILSRVRSHLELKGLLHALPSRN